MSALLYGFNAGLGFSPHTLGMVLKTIVGGRKNGLLFMLSGLSLDLLLITGVYILSGSFEVGKSFQYLLHLLSGIVVIRMGIKAYYAKPNLNEPVKSISSWREGFLVQLLNPNPYLFWFVIGVPYMVSLNNNALAFQFVLIFLIVTYGLKTTIVEICARASSGEFLSGKRFIFVRKCVSILTILNGLHLLLKEQL